MNNKNGVNIRIKTGKRKSTLNMDVTKVKEIGDGVEKTANGDQNSSVVVKTEADDKYATQRLLKYQFVPAYTTTLSLRVITICPFQIELLENPIVKEAISTSEEYAIRKTNAKSVLVLLFGTFAAGDQIFMELCQEFPEDSRDFTIEHPLIDSTLSLTYIVDSILDRELSIEREASDDIIGRQLVLEKVPDTVPLEKIFEIFPEAKQILDFRDYERAKGIITLEMDPSEINRVLEEKREIELDGHAVYLGRYITRSYKWQKQATKEQGRKTDKTRLTDEERISISKSVQGSFKRCAETLNKTDITSEMKTKMCAQILNEFTDIHSKIIVDTRRRLNAGENPIPEGLELAIPIVRREVNRRSKETPSKVPDTPTSSNISKQEPSFRQQLLDKTLKQAQEKNLQATLQLLQRPGAVSLQPTALRGRGAAMRGGVMREGTVRGAGRGSPRGAPRGALRGATRGTLRGALRGAAMGASRGAASQAMARGAGHRGGLLGAPRGRGSLFGVGGGCTQRSPLKRRGAFTQARGGAGGAVPRGALPQRGGASGMRGRGGGARGARGGPMRMRGRGAFGTGQFAVPQAAAYEQDYAYEPAPKAMRFGGSWEEEASGEQFFEDDYSFDAQPLQPPPRPPGLGKSWQPKGFY